MPLSCTYSSLKRSQNKSLILLSFPMGEKVWEKGELIQQSIIVCDPYARTFLLCIRQQHQLLREGISPGALGSESWR